ncbi:hypothetical protein [Gorillibacterium timonense]|uniref:hypothetical protein n=1 Tax=Gorillibacterium timonense TaxID=1689269 RepID=UPI00071C6127|nr:hypothetical protein [Gorillibacterium timonense]
MHSSPHLLVTDSELFAAALLDWKVLVLQHRNQVTLVYPGMVERFDPDWVRVNGIDYSRRDCEFHIL